MSTIEWLTCGLHVATLIILIGVIISRGISAQAVTHQPLDADLIAHLQDVQRNQQVAITQILNGLRSLDEHPTLLDRPITTRAPKTKRARVVKGGGIV